jgi:FdhD protein
MSIVGGKEGGEGGGASRGSWLEYERAWKSVVGEIIEEAPLTIFANGVELVTLMCSPRNQVALGLGFLRSEGFIDGMEEVRLTHLSQDGCCVDFWLSKPLSSPGRRVLTSGCAGGVTFSDPASALEPVGEEIELRPSQLEEWMSKLRSQGELHARAGGVHTAGMADETGLFLIAEDVGRHNAFDKLLGLCMVKGLATEGKILLSTGRISSEMLRKAAVMGCPLVGSLRSPTALAVRMAEEWNITIVGYIRRGSLRVYTHPRRLGIGREMQHNQQDG